ncbi:hypothetical protein OG792_32800 [Micromonospora sp. NBC_01699]|uniref:VG15 protein n=1 Tax=Micromonospora sp. NBC_01699 TaxID=2975984 RepID=UPI002E2AD873|nr:hypothetical protein [Micromonospora sp. NBC_01699]
MAELTPTQAIELYRLAQAQIAGEAASRAVVAFNALLDPANLDGSFGSYLRVLALITDDARQRMAATGGQFYLTHREAMQVLADAPPVLLAGALPPEQMTTVALVTGPVEVKRAIIRGEPISVAMSKAAATTAGAVFRLTANAGRDTIDTMTARDRLALGWARVTDGNPCSFCALLASRGPVYKSDQSATGRKGRYHGKCGCHPVAVYSKGDPWPGKAREFEALYESATEGESGRDAINAFRRAYEAQQRAAA